MRIIVVESLIKCRDTTRQNAFCISESSTHPAHFQVRVRCADPVGVEHAQADKMLQWVSTCKIPCKVGPIQVYQVYRVSKPIGPDSHTSNATG